MPERCKSCSTRDANNNTTNGGGYGGGTGTGGPRSGAPCAAAVRTHRNIQVTAKVLFGSVQAISHMKMEEKAARENKRT